MKSMKRIEALLRRAAGLLPPVQRRREREALRREQRERMDYIAAEGRRRFVEAMPPIRMV